MMVSRQNGARTRVLIVEQDLNFGMKLADGLATDGYHPVFVRTVDAAIGSLSGVRPQAIFVGIGCSAPAVRIDIAEAHLLIKSVCPSVPVRTIADQTSENLTRVVIRQGGRRFLVKLVELSKVGEVLQSELSAATA
jgi:DNA-binding response OmpR family regulator